MKDDNNLGDKIYTVRGAPVMLDADLAEIYGYTTKAFNQQVTRNIERFEGEEFMFRLTSEEVEKLSRSQIVTSIGPTSISQKTTLMQTKGTKGGRAYLPYAFTEQGVYMLMTVLRGKLAVKQSRALIMAFKTMKDYIIENKNNLDYRGSLQLALRVADNSNDIANLKSRVDRLDKKTKDMADKIDETVTRGALSPLMLDFERAIARREYIFMDGQPMKANEAYIEICSRAKQNLYIIDNYINIKTLRCLQDVDVGVKIVIFSDNVGSHLRARDYRDFKKEFPQISVDFVTVGKNMHDRFIVLDYGLEGEKIYHCGASMKDAGNKITAIGTMGDGAVKDAVDGLIARFMGNPKLKLR